jgi:hypothetical protein
MRVIVWMPVEVRAPPRSPNAQTSRPDVGGAATGADRHQPSTRTPTDAATSSNAGSAGDDPLFRHVRTRVRSPQTNGVIERFFGTLTYEHLYRATIGDGNALAVEVNLFRHTYNTLATPPGPRRGLTTRGLPRRRTLRLACGLWRTRYLTGRS